MNTVQWIIEDFMGDDNTSALYETLQQYTDVVYKKYYDFTYDELCKINSKRPVIAYGSIQFLQKIREWGFEWSPGIIGANYSKYSIDAILRNYQKYALNYESSLCTLDTFLDSLHKPNIPYPESVFIRPNMPDKAFNGQCVYLGNIDHFQREELDVYEVPLDTQICISPIRNITYEWRCIICNKHIVTITCYKDHGKSVRYDVKDGIDLEFFVYHMIRLYCPDDVFVLDICQTETQYYVLELGMFSCSGLYTMNTDAIVTVLHTHYQQ